MQGPFNKTNHAVALDETYTSCWQKLFDVAGITATFSSYRNILELMQGLKPLIIL